MSRLIIVCGLPGSGKTTLAKELARRLNIASLHKDEIKEHLYDTFVGETLEDSKKYGKASLSLLFHLTESHLENGIDLMIEAPFYVDSDWEMFKNWEREHDVEVTTIICNAETEERARRIGNRPRHRAHHDIDRRLCSVDGPGCQFDYEAVVEKYIKVETDRPVEELVDEILGEIGADRTADQDGL